MATKLAEAYIEITGRLAPLRKALSKAINITKKSMKIAAVGIVAAMVASTKAAATFQEQLANVSTMLDTQTRRLLPAYAAGIRKLAIDFGVGTTTLAQGLYNVLSASVDATKALNVLEVATKAAAAGITETNTAAYAITGVMNAYGYAADQASAVSDILFATVKKGQTNFEQLASSVGKVTAISASAGIELEQVGAALATITRGGISTAEAVTGLRAAIISLMGKEKGAIALAKKHGIELSTQGLKAKGLVGMVRDLSALNPEVLKNIFKETEARVALNVLIKDQTGFLKDYEATLGAAGATQDAYNQQLGLLTLSFRKMWQTIKITGQIFGDQLQPIVKYTFDSIAKFLIENQETFKKWGKIVAYWLYQAFLYFQNLSGVIKDEGWGAATEKMMKDINDALNKGWATMKSTVFPIAVEIGKELGKGILQGLRATIGARLLNTVKEVMKTNLAVAEAVIVTVRQTLPGGLPKPSSPVKGFGTPESHSTANNLNTLTNAIDANTDALLNQNTVGSIR